jgi:gas vesicle protein
MGKREMRGLIIGGIAGAIAGMAVAWILLTRPQGESEKQEFSWTEVLKLAASFLRLAERLSHLL